MSLPLSTPFLAVEFIFPFLANQRDGVCVIGDAVAFLLIPSTPQVVTRIDKLLCQKEDDLHHEFFWVAERVRRTCALVRRAPKRSRFSWLHSPLYIYMHYVLRTGC